MQRAFAGRGEAKEPIYFGGWERAGLTWLLSSGPLSDLLLAEGLLRRASKVSTENCQSAIAISTNRDATNPMKGPFFTPMLPVEPVAQNGTPPVWLWSAVRLFQLSSRSRFRERGSC